MPTSWPGAGAPCGRRWPRFARRAGRNRVCTGRLLRAGCRGRVPARPGDAVAAAGEPLPPEVLHEALEALDPEAVLLLDDAAARAMRDAYADALVVIEDFDTAMLKPGLIAPVLGRRVLALDGFEAALNDSREKQRMWAYIKRLPPAGAPY